ncbi:hypothetical protein K3725_09850 [Leisingera sp. S132]|uniref:hypothetical protein n=1 Tax=Leisingera sp. S132 TaxID=2867016 RepID=UPI0021A69BCF|nr:hypothetical protein [Leisingera sp. S132]UWQ77626.1 hypothetical protein K3725_09850 [Leisingera sp. S132]
MAAGVAPNTLGKFEDERVKSREIHLSTAAKIYRTALAMASEKDVELPPLDHFAKDQEGGE